MKAALASLVPPEAGRVRESSFLWTCLRGECSKINRTLRGYVVPVFRLPFRTKETGAQSAVLSPSPDSLGKSTDNPNAGTGQGHSTWPQVPIESAGLLACPTQTGVLGAHET